MKASEIKPGVVYAWQDGNNEYARVRPVMFLAQPGPKAQLYSKGERYRKTPEGGLIFVAQPGRPRVGIGYSGLTIGYPAVGIPSFGTGWDEPIAEAIKFMTEHAADLTLDAFKAAKAESAGPEVRWFVFPTLAKVKGEWGEFMAQREAKAAAKADAERVAAEHKATIAARWDTVRIELGAVLGDGKPIPTFYQWEAGLKLPLEMCEELVSVLQVAREALLDDPINTEDEK